MVDHVLCSSIGEKDIMRWQSEIQGSPERIHNDNERINVKRDFNEPEKKTFLGAFSHLYKRVCLSVGPSVRRSVGGSVRRLVTRFF